MEAHVLTPGTPKVVDRLVSQLKSDCGSAAEVELIPEASENRYTINVVGKQQRLLSLFQPEFSVIQCVNKRTGPNVRTTIVFGVSSATLTEAAR